MKCPDKTGAEIFTIPLLKNIKYLVLLDAEAVEEFGKINDLEHESVVSEYKNWGGTTTCLVSEGNHYFLVALKDLNIENIVHESVHLAQLILEFHGINTDKRNTEILAYTTTHIFETIKEFWDNYLEINPLPRVEP